MWVPGQDQKTRWPESPGGDFLTVLLPWLYRFQCFFAHPSLLSSGYLPHFLVPLFLCLALPASAPPLSRRSLVQLVPVSKINYSLS